MPDASEDAEALEAVRPGEAPRRYVQRVYAPEAAGRPAAFADPGFTTAPVLCADTTVLDSTILGKPATADEARRMLAQLSGAHAPCSPQWPWELFKKESINLLYLVP